MAKVFFRPRAVKGLNSASKYEQGRIKSAIEVLKTRDFPLHTKKLGGTTSGYRIRIGKWRILFVFEKEEIDVIDIFIKKGGDDYRKL